ncbi:MAG: hypothetical protein WCC65_05035 [Pseudonocardiaceae bacterium]
MTRIDVVTGAKGRHSGGKFRVAVGGGRPAPANGAKELGIDVVLVHEKGKYDEAVALHCEQIVHAPGRCKRPVECSMSSRSVVVFKRSGEMQCSRAQIGSGGVHDR